MKLTCTTLLILLCTLVYAQNYHCLFPGMQRYYTNSNNYLRGIRIDSSAVVGPNTYFYTFKTIRNLEHYRASASWLGSPVYSDSAGLFHFGTRRGDTVIIRSRAQRGDSWVLFDDTTSIRYVATVTNVDTGSVLGIPDSIKTITLSVWADTVMMTTSTMNGFTIKIAKNSGFVQLFDFYHFPYTDMSLPDSNDYYRQYGVAWAETDTRELFHVANYKPPTKLELNDFQTGDVFISKLSNWCLFSVLSGMSGSCDIYTGWTYDSVVSAVDLDAYHRQYIIYHILNETNEGDYHRNYHHFLTFFDTSIADTSRGMPLQGMPEEAGTDAGINEYHKYLYFAYPQATSFCDTSDEYFRDANYADPPYFYLNRYKKGFGIINQVKCEWGNSAYGGGWENHIVYRYYKDMVYARKNGQVCGTYVSVGIPQLDNLQEVQLYPNPATLNLFISTHFDNGFTIRISNALGTTQILQQSPTAQASVDVSNLPDGLYLVTITASTGKPHISKIVIHH